MGAPVLCLAATVGLGESGASSPRPAAAPVRAQSQPPPIDPAPVTPSMAAQAVAEPKPAATPKFEVISVKPSAACGDGGGRGGDVGGVHWSPGRLSVECSTAIGLVRMAYVRFAEGEGRRQTFSMTAPPAPNEPIEGGPPWISSSRYDIDAKADGAPGLETMSGPMMRSLLEDRFQLKIRREIRTIPVYQLTVANGGPKLQVAQPGKCVPFVFGKDPMPPPGPPIVPRCGWLVGPLTTGGGDTYGQTMAGLCWQFSGWLERPVIDKTGIVGAFDIHLELSAADLRRDDDAPTDPASPAIPADPFGAISAAVRKLGLKLSPAKGPGAFLVIDHVEKPSEN
jgi:uncharacterized protein (TIGR03435 family)